MVFKMGSRLVVAAVDSILSDGMFITKKLPHLTQRGRAKKKAILRLRSIPMNEQESGRFSG
jgi:hypothetical protein